MENSDSFFDSVLNKPNTIINEDETTKMVELLKLEPYSGTDPEVEVETAENPDPFIGHGFGDDFN